MMQNLKVRKKIVKNFLYINIHLTSKIRNVLGHPVVTFLNRKQLNSKVLQFQENV